MTNTILAMEYAAKLDREDREERMNKPDQALCPNCVSPWKCNGPHITESEGEAEKLLRECREELFRYGEDSACAWEHGDTRSRREAEESRDELYTRIDAYLKGKP